MFDDLKAVTLVGSSSGGTVITTVADRIPERVERLIIPFVTHPKELTQVLTEVIAL